MKLNKVILPRNVWPKRTDWSGKVVEIYVNKGDKVSRGDALLDVEIEKAILTIESEVEGIIKKIYVSKGDEVYPGDLLLEIET